MSDTGVRLIVRGSKEVRAAMKGMADETLAAQAKIERGDKQRMTSAKLSSRQRTQLAKRAIATEVAEERRGLRAFFKSTTERGRSLRTRVKDEQRAARDIRKARQQTEGGRGAGGGSFGGGGSGRLGALGGAALGFGASMYGHARSSQGVLGVRTKEEILSETLAIRQEVIRAAAQAGMSDAEQEKLFAKANETALKTGVGPNQLLGGALVAQESFSDLRGYAENMQFFGEVVRSQGAEMADVVNMAGELQRQFNLTGESMQEAMLMLIQGSADGSLAIRDFATEMPEVFNTMKGARGVSGVEAIKEFSAVAQQLRAGGVGAAQTKTQFSALMTSLADKNVQKRLGAIGLDVVNKETGGVRGLDEIFSNAKHFDRLGNLGVIKQVLGTDEAARAFLTLRNQESGDMTLGQRMAVDPSSARKTIDDTLARLDADESGKAQRLAVEKEVGIVSQYKELTDAMLSIAGPLTKLEAEFPLLTEAITTLTGTLGGGLAGNLLFGGGPKSGGGFLSKAGSKLTGALGWAGEALGLGGGAGLAAGTVAAVPLAFGMYRDSNVDDLDATRKKAAQEQMQRAIAGGDSKALSKAFEMDRGSIKVGFTGKSAAYAPQPQGPIQVDFANTPFARQMVDQMKEQTKAVKEQTRVARSQQSGSKTGYDTGDG